MQVRNQNTIPECATKGDIVLGEANSGRLRGDFEAMQKRRHQQPKPKKDGNFWYVRVWQDSFAGGVRIRKRQRIKLAPASMHQREVLKIADEVLRPLNQGLISVGSAVNFSEYVNNEYNATVLPLLASSTQDSYTRRVRKYLIPAFGGLCLRDLTPGTLQRYFSGMASQNVSYP